MECAPDLSGFSAENGGALRLVAKPSSCCIIDLKTGEAVPDLVEAFSISKIEKSKPGVSE